MLRPHVRLLAQCAFVSLTLGAGGCNDATYSCRVENANLLLRATVTEFDAEAHEPRVRVEIELDAVGEDVGAGTSLTLCPEGDRLEVNGVETEELNTLGHLYYIAEFKTRESSYEIALTRPDHEDVVIEIALPPAFEISQPLAGAMVARSGPLDIAWEPGWSDQQVALSVADEIGSTCINGLGIDLDVDDTGSYSVPAGTLVGSGVCQVTISLTRLAEAEYPSSLAPGGNVTAIVKRRRVVTSI